jgi:hypothetical protein
MLRATHVRVRNTLVLILALLMFGESISHSPVVRADPITEKVLGVTEIGEQQSVYCGPASAQMVLKYKGKTYSQAYLAGQLGTNGGTNWSNFSFGTTLNSDLGYFFYVQVTASTVSETTSETTFSNDVSADIGQGYPLILGIQESPTYNIDYNEGQNYWQHYIVIDGYEDNQGVISFHFVDPGGAPNVWSYSGHQPYFTPASYGWTSLSTAWHMMLAGGYGFVW